MKVMVKNETQQFTTVIQELEKSFVSIIETVTKNMNTLNDRTDNIDKVLTTTKTSVDTISNKLNQTQGTSHENISDALQKLSCLKKYEDQNSCIKKLETENNQLKTQLHQTKHECLLSEPN